jgi:hypothetical protein
VTEPPSPWANGYIHLAPLADLRLTAVGCAKVVLKLYESRTDLARKVIEAALAHVAGDEMEAAYQRGDVFDKRRKLMEAWAAYYCERRKDRVISARVGLAGV